MQKFRALLQAAQASPGASLGIILILRSSVLGGARWQSPRGATRRHQEPVRATALRTIRSRRSASWITSEASIGSSNCTDL